MTLNEFMRPLFGVTKAISPEAAMEIGKTALVGRGFVGAADPLTIREGIIYFSIYPQTEVLHCVVARVHVETGKVSIEPPYPR